MAYYHILRQRRQDLNLSIEYVSSQTRLAPQYIQAIEQHNLDVFSDDFSFVRYFVHAYCDAIGVNWIVIKDEVDADINAYARQRSMALSQAQKKLIAQMPNGKSKTKQHSKHPGRSRYQKSISALSRNIQWKNRKNIKTWIVGGVVILGLIVGLNFIMDLHSSNQAAQEEALRQEELREKEEETDRLAQQRQSERESQEIVLTSTNPEENIYQMSNVLETTQKFTIKIELPEESTVVIYKDDVPLDESTVDELYSGTFEQEVEVTEPCTIAVEVGTYVGEGTTFSFADNNVTFNPTYWAYGAPATFYIEVVSNETLEQKSQTSSDGQTAVNENAAEETAYEFTE